MSPLPTSGIVPALDLGDLTEALRLVEDTTDIEGVAGYKIGQAVVLDVGLERVVSALRSVTDLPLIYDHQKLGLDVPSNATLVAAAVAAARVDGVVVFPVAGPSALRSFVRAALDRGVRPLVGAALPLPDYTESGGGWLADDVLERVTRLAVGEGAKDVVVPASDLPRVERLTGDLAEREADLGVYLPGIDAGERGLVARSLRAARGRRAYAIVGRAIHAAPDPVAATRALAGEAVTLARA